MPDLSFEVRGAETASDEAGVIVLHLEIANRPAGENVDSIVLRCQIRIETPRRRYTDSEKRGLHELFGEPERWGQTLRPMLWTNLAITVPAFSGTASAMLRVPCVFEPSAGVTKYFEALEGGTVPITLLFSGTVFYEESDGRLQAAPIPWSKEARFAFPVEVWKQCALEVGV